MSPFSHNWSFDFVLRSLPAGGFYSQLVKPGLRLVSLNTILYYGPDQVTVNMTDPAGQFVWLEKTLEKAAQNLEKVCNLTCVIWLMQRFQVILPVMWFWSCRCTSSPTFLWDTCLFMETPLLSGKSTTRGWWPSSGSSVMLLQDSFMATLTETASWCYWTNKVKQKKSKMTFEHRIMLK